MTVTQKDKSEILRQAGEAARAGDYDKIVELGKKLPLHPFAAKGLLLTRGAEYVKNSGFDLSLAEEMYGKDWLSKSE